MCPGVESESFVDRPHVFRKLLERLPKNTEPEKAGGSRRAVLWGPKGVGYVMMSS